ncbi:MAG: hypothetical protein AAFV19_20385 [Pseudomonadota bacterium]
MRFSAAPTGRLDDPTQPWAVFGDRPGDPDGLEGNALAGVNLAQIAATPGAPMFDHESLFGAHMAGQAIDDSRDGPVVVFVHGFESEPRRPVKARAYSDNAHRKLFHFSEPDGGPGSAEERALRITPWFARAMLAEGVGPADACHGVAVGYCFTSYGGSARSFLPGPITRLASRAGITRRWREPPDVYVSAYRDAEIAGYGLAAVLTQLRARLDHAGQTEREIDILCHSLGARTVLSALALISQRWPADSTLSRISRVIMLGGVCYLGQAAQALAHMGRAKGAALPHLYNVTSRSDDVLRFLAQHRAPQAARAEAEEALALDPARIRLLRAGRTIGRNGQPPHTLYAKFAQPYPAWADIPLDDPATRRWGFHYGFDLRGRRTLSLGDHWLYWTHPGNWALYRAILHDREGWSAPEVAADLRTA